MLPTAPDAAGRRVAVRDGVPAAETALRLPRALPPTTRLVPTRRPVALRSGG